MIQQHRDISSHSLARAVGDFGAGDSGDAKGGAAQAPKALCCQVLWNSPPAAGDALGQALSGLAGQVPALEVTLVLCFHLPRKMCCVLGVFPVLIYICPDFASVSDLFMTFCTTVSKRLENNLGEKRERKAWQNHAQVDLKTGA